MKHFAYILNFFALAFSSLMLACACNTGSSNKPPVASQYNGTAFTEGLNLISGKRQADNDSHIWVDSSNGFAITRILDNGLYKYVFWKTASGKPVVAYADSVGSVQFIQDSLYDVNGDGFSDYILNCVGVNGQCQPEYSILYCFDKKSDKLVHIPAIADIPNPKFYPSEKVILSTIDCQMKKDSSKFKWNGLLLDTIYIKTSN